MRPKPHIELLVMGMSKTEKRVSTAVQIWRGERLNIYSDALNK